MSAYCNLSNQNQIPSVPQSYNFTAPQLQTNLNPAFPYFAPQTFTVQGTQLIPQPSVPQTHLSALDADIEAFNSNNYPNPEKTEGTLKPRYHSVNVDADGTFNSITIMGPYHNKSFEELRLEDYINYQKNSAAYSKEKLADNKNNSNTTTSTSSSSVPIEENYAKKYAEAMGEVKSMLGDAVRKMNQLENLTEHYLCVVCKSVPKDIAFLPCAHFSCCNICSKQLNTCPICRQPIQTKLKLHT